MVIPLVINCTFAALKKGVFYFNLKPTAVYG